jgi:hypothetical protein
LLVTCAATLRGQQPTRPAQPDTVKPKPPAGDTLRRPSAMDTVRARRDSVTIAVPAGVDSARKARIDSVHGIADTLKARVRRDSIKAPLARAEFPTSVGVGPIYRWTRDSVYSTGATSLAGLLERIPGVTVFRTGYLASSQTAAYLGDFTRIRVFRDGVELDAIDPRSGGITDVADLQLTNLDAVTVERTAGEIRVYARTWSTRNTTPYSRVDAFTGDEDTNIYRFFFGRRFGGGFDVQASAQQVATGVRNTRVGGGGSVLDALARVGWARGRWSVDATYFRLDRERNTTRTYVEQDSILPHYQGRRNEGYLRLGYGDPEGRGPWLQLIGNSLNLTVAGTAQKVPVGRFKHLASGALVQDTLVIPDSSLSRRQYVASAGLTFAGVKLSASDRVRSIAGTTFNSPSARASYDTRLFSASVFAENDAVGGAVVDSILAKAYAYKTTATSTGAVLDSALVTKPLGALAPPTRTTRVDATVRFSPLSWFALIGSFSNDSRSFYAVGNQSNNPPAGPPPLDTTAASTKTSATRLEAAVRFHRIWFSGGVIRRGPDLLIPPRVYECIRPATVGRTCTRLLADTETVSATGVLAGIRGNFYKDAYLDVNGVGWKAADASYRPQYQLRGEIGVLTNWLSRFPSGNFGFKAAAIDEYRSRVRFPNDVDLSGGGEKCALQECVAPSNVLTLLLEIRIQTGALTYRLSNALNRPYELVPGARMPGPVSFYGLRWTFWN